MKKIRNSFVIILLSIFVTLSSMVPVYALDTALEEDAASYVDEKIYCQATIDDDFIDDSVLVVLDRNVSGINKVHEKAFLVLLLFKTLWT